LCCLSEIYFGGNEIHALNSLIRNKSKSNSILYLGKVLFIRFSVELREKMQKIFLFVIKVKIRKLLLI